MNEIISNYWHVGIVGMLLVAISIGFFARFVFPARRLGRELRASISAIVAIRDRTQGHIIELGEIASEAMSEPRLAHLWSEYAETLHPQREDDGVQMRVAKWRATALADSFFTEQALVDTPLKADFYKHLPGILTGLGIIGTFSGLIMGLINFDVSLNPLEAQKQLRALVNSVGHAFFVSAAAIGLAMLFTWIEKSLVTSCYRQVEELRQLIDSLFDAGAGEEYLERLVVASETNATQARHIKDALVADLKEILTGLTAQQVEAHAKNTGQISVDIGKAIGEHLGAPMAEIATAVKSVSANQGDAVNRMLTDVLAGFSSQMKDMFGGQMTGMTDLLKETSESMRATADRFGQLAANMDNAGRKTVDAMADRLNHAISSMEARQQIMNKQMGEFVEQIKAMVAQSQGESARKLQETLGVVGDQVAGVVAELRKQAEEAAESQGRRQERYEESTSKAIGSLSGEVEMLLTQSAETSRSLQDTVARLSDATERAVTGLASGADTLYVAATDFAKAGQGVAETMRASGDAVEGIRSAAGTLAGATGAAKDIIADYGRTRDAFATMVDDLKRVTENARRDAALTSEIIGKIEVAAQHLADAETEAGEYLEGVTEVLGKAHESFAENVERSLREGNRQFQKELRDAVNLVSGAVKDLGDTLDDLPRR
ncbi:anti-phage ZorAB system protein ZorA [Zoogloea sp.]|uniref:anti-phage ZorAB system protein ZorA n=1 Tax=Zoogloea sp. TaxID=49181 RepID=UPI001415EB35|nr:MAG: anti-phage defense ZorAB system ZorA [Zoogloea sp.]